MWRAYELGVIAGTLGRQPPKVETMPGEAAEDLLAFTSFPPGCWTRPVSRAGKAQV